jgi:outer membrane protein assembly factor BamD
MLRFRPLRSSVFRLLGLVAVLLTSAGCGSTTGINAETPQQAFEKGLDLYERGKYLRAIDYFRGVFDYGRTHEWADDATFYLGRAYQANDEFLLAANEYGRFVEIYRSDPRAEEAEFYRVQSYVALSPRFELDQSDTERAVTYGRLYLNRYPQGAYADEVVATVEELRAKLARKQYETAKLYETRELYEAAALSFEEVLDQFPTSAYADDALAGAVVNWVRYAELSVPGRRAARYQSAVDNYQRLLEIFPDSPRLKEVEDDYGTAQAYLDRQAAAEREAAEAAQTARGDG